MFVLSSGVPSCHYPCYHQSSHYNTGIPVSAKVMVMGNDYGKLIPSMPYLPRWADRGMPEGVCLLTTYMRSSTAGEGNIKSART